MTPGLFERRREDQFQRVQWLLFFRLAVAIVGIVLVLVVAGGSTEFRAPYAVLVGACALDVVYLIAARRIENLSRFAGWQIAVDGVLVTTLVYLTGGVYSFAAILYFALILAASLCVSGRMSVVFASAATVALAGVQVLYHVAAHYEVALPLVDPSVFFEARLRAGRDAAYLIAQGLAFHLVAALSSWLAAELRRVKILYGEILEKMAEGLVVIDADGRIVFVNHEARRLLEYTSPRNLIGLDFREVFRRRPDHAVLDLLLAPDAVAAEIEVETREGGRRSVAVKTSVLRDERGRLRGTIGIFTDLTLKKQAEAAEKRAERLEGIEALAMGIAHEVRNPLASIRGCVQELGRMEFMGEDERQLARIICRESDRLDGIIGEFLQFARLKPPEIGDVDLAAVVREVAVLLRGRVPDGRVQVEVEGVETAPIRGDAQLLTQVFLNLGINAIEAIEGQGEVAIAVRPAVSPRLAPEGNGLRRVLDEAPGFEVSFTDTGRGIPAENASRIFAPFFTTKSGGTGLGLPLAARIVKAHGGTIAVESPARPNGRGTTFRVILPARARVADVAAAW